jgi:hypothetical protein
MWVLDIQSYTQLYTSFTKLINFVYVALLYTLSYAKEIILILDIDGQNTTYVFAFKDTHIAHLSLDL